MPDIVKTEDGSHTLFVPEIGEHFHSIYGAIGESDFIYINNGLKHSKANPVRIFEVGFGTGLNALLSAVYSVNHGTEIFYSSIEKYPLDETIINSLNYNSLVKSRERNLFERIHSCKWNVPEKVIKNFTLFKINSDLITDEITGSFDLIYFDAFSPDKQPEMWTEDIFEKISRITVRNGIFVTYSAKGSVKRLLRNSGFNVTLLPGPTGKRQIIRAVKI